MSIPERWRDVAGFEGVYQVSNYGRVKSLDRIDCVGRQLKGTILSHSVCGPYKSVTVPLWKDGKQENHSVQRLVAIAFIPNPDRLPFVRRINPAGNHPAALELKWANRKYAGQHGHHH